MSFKSLPDASGAVELGYGVNPSYRGRGYATEMARAMVSWVLKQPKVKRVNAECLEANLASIRVLKKIGFKQVGGKIDEEGPLAVWEAS